MSRHWHGEGVGISWRKAHLAYAAPALGCAGPRASLSNVGDSGGTGATEAAGDAGDSGVGGAAQADEGHGFRHHMAAKDESASTTQPGDAQARRKSSP